MICSDSISRDLLLVSSLTCESTQCLGIFWQHGNAALHEAAWNGYSRTLELLCKAKASVHLVNKVSVLYFLQRISDRKWYRKRHRTFIKLHYMSCNCFQAGFSALHLAAQNGHNQSARVLLYSGASPDHRNNVSFTLLLKSCV